MVNKRQRRKYEERRHSFPEPIGEQIFQLLQKMGGDPEKGKLAELWREWPRIMGEELAELTRPAGSKGATLLVTAEDAIAMQEALFRAPETLARANAYLNSNRFQKLRVTLENGKN